MSDDDAGDAVVRLLRLIADHLEDFLDGNELALETLGEAIEQGPYSVEEAQAAILTLRSLGAAGPATAWVAERPGKHAQRVLSREERDSLSPEAWGYLIGLRDHGSLDSEQFERVLDLLTGSGVRPVGVDLAREVAARVALSFEGESGEDDRHGDRDQSH